MLPVLHYQITAFTLLARRLVAVRTVELPATNVMRAIWAAKAINPDPRPLVYRARRVR
ncbi:hypothetical protein ACK31M_19720 [Aeromonas caviae]|jgi:hypothetical protein